MMVEHCPDPGMTETVDLPDRDIARTHMYYCCSESSRSDRWADLTIGRLPSIYRLTFVLYDSGRSFHQRPGRWYSSTSGMSSLPTESPLEPTPRHLID